MRRFGRETRGQSAVEIALVLPLLLLLVLGIADLGRFAHNAIGVTHAARDAAAYAVKDPRVTESMVQSRVCAEMGLGGSECAVLMTAGTLDIKCFRGGQSCETRRTPGDVSVRVRFDLALLTSVIAERVGMNVIPIRGDATFPGYTQ